MRDRFNAYKRIYPNIFRKDAEEKLNGIFAEGFVVGNGVNKKFMEPHKLEDLIKSLWKATRQGLTPHVKR